VSQRASSGVGVVSQSLPLGGLPSWKIAFEYTKVIQQIGTGATPVVALPVTPTKFTDPCQHQARMKTTWPSCCEASTI
jgi:hypothetical protein